MEVQALWNRLHVPLPGALSSVRVPFTTTTDVRVKAVVAQGEALRRLLRSDSLQTEVRVLYELLYTLNNNFRAMKSFKALKQVEQCVERLRRMKLDAALQELVDLCPTRIQRGLSLKAGEGEVPSQPMLEWLCLRVVGGAHLMQRAMQRSSRAFLLSRNHMKWEEFIILNMLLSSLLCRLWVMFRGVLWSLLALYSALRELLREVSSARPMPFLGAGVLPADAEQLLGSALPATELRAPPRAKGKTAQKKQKPSVWTEQRGTARKKKEDLGVSIQRDVLADADLKPFLTLFKKGAPKQQQQQRRGNVSKAERQQMFEAQVKRAATFAAMATSLDGIIRGCASRNMNKEKALLNFARVKCEKMKQLEAEGYNLQRKLRSFKQEVSRALCPRGPLPKPLPLHTPRRSARLQRRLHSLRRRWKMAAIRVPSGKKGRTKSTDWSELAELQGKHAKIDETLSESSECKSLDDIDEIFSSVGL